MFENGPPSAEATVNIFHRRPAIVNSSGSNKFHRCSPFFVRLLIEKLVQFLFCPPISFFPSAVVFVTPCPGPGVTARDKLTVRILKSDAHRLIDTYLPPVPAEISHFVPETRLPDITAPGTAGRNEWPAINLASRFSFRCNAPTATLT